jgi:diguanylate cyclase (GGDEF)-like protein
MRGTLSDSGSLDTDGERSSLLMPAEPATSERDLQRRYWKLAAVLFIGGGLGAIPADALHRPAHEPTIYLLPLLALLSGAVCWLIADRVSRRWLPVMTAVATLEIALTVWVAGEVFAIYYILVCFFAAYVFSDRRMVAFQFAFASLMALLPVAHDPDSARQTLIQGLVLIPTLLLTAGAITFLRERLQASEERFRRLAESDPLTGVGNYRVLLQKLPRELSHHRRHQRQLALIVVDLDDFKRVNDDFGHQRGDRVLQEVAGSLMGSVRTSDVLVRHGGDEFCVVAPETDRDRAEELAARLRRDLAQVEVEGRRMGACTGCAVFPEDGDDLDALLARADERLRVSKESKPSLSRTAL